MTGLTEADVEAWLAENPERAKDLFLRTADRAWVNAWLALKGLKGHGTTPTPSSPTSAAIVITEERRLSEGTKTQSAQTSDNSSSASNSEDRFLHHSLTAKRVGSKRCLRHDFARSKSRSLYRTRDIQQGIQPPTARRSSLKDLRKYASLPPSSVTLLSLLIESKVRLPHCGPIEGRASKRQALGVQGERTFFLTSVKDLATDLDLASLTKKIVDDAAVLMEADGASLFLVKNAPGSRKSLVSKVFDVHSGAGRFLITGNDCDTEVEVPWGVGIIGHVAESGNTVNLQVACQDPRFDDEVDLVMGYHTESLLCMPVRNSNDEIIAVAQIVNKYPDQDCGHFTAKDEKLFETYLQFVGIALTNAQIIETSRLEFDRNRALLEVVHDLFEEQTSLEKVVLKIMERAQRLLQCDRAAVLLVDEQTNPTTHQAELKFSKLFELTSANGQQTCNNGWLGGMANSATGSRVDDGCVGGTSYLIELAQRVAATGKVANVTPPATQQNVTSLLAMPIRNSAYHIIGVAAIINKNGGVPFDENDEQLFEAFTIFCGLGIHNTIMYSEVEKAMARQKVTIEVLSYHATASPKEVNTLLEIRVPGCDELNLYSLSFDDFSLNPEEMILGAVSMFHELGLVKRFNIDNKTLYRFLITVKRNYRDVPYHNWRHAFNVAQVMFAILMGCEMKGTFGELEVLGMIVACLCHDLDHRGTNNAYQQKSGSALVLLYGTTNTMEHHHFNQAVMILNSQGLNIFSSISAESYSLVMKVLRHSILATDLSTYFQIRDSFFSLIESRRYSWEGETQRRLLSSMLMTAADLAASSKPWPVQKRAASLVAQEFLQQGDKERQELNIQPPAPMDRDRQHELPKLQITWIADICLPLYQSLAQMNPKLSGMAEGARENMEQWSKLAQQQQEEIAAENCGEHSSK